MSSACSHTGTMIKKYVKNESIIQKLAYLQYTKKMLSSVFVEQGNFSRASMKSHPLGNG